MSHGKEKKKRARKSITVRKRSESRQKTFVARAFFMSGFGRGEIHRVVDFCIDGMHVHYTAIGYYWVNTAENVHYTVTNCAGSCKDKPVLQEREFTAELVEFFHSILGQGEWPDSDPAPEY